MRYLEGCRQLINAGRGANATMETWFDKAATEAEQRNRADTGLELAGKEIRARLLDGVIGQAVHPVCLPNTTCRLLTDEDMDKLYRIISRSFPSATAQEGHAIFDGTRRPILLARVRTDGVVALAQRLCIAFEQRFIGLEVGGRYIHVHSDDT